MSGSTPSSSGRGRAPSGSRGDLREPASSTNTAATGAGLRAPLDRLDLGERVDDECDLLLAGGGPGSSTAAAGAAASGASRTRAWATWTAAFARVEPEVSPRRAASEDHLFCSHGTRRASHLPLARRGAALGSRDGESEQAAPLPCARRPPEFGARARSSRGTTLRARGREPSDPSPLRRAVRGPRGGARRDDPGPRRRQRRRRAITARVNSIRGSFQSLRRRWSCPARRTRRGSPCRRSARCSRSSARGGPSPTERRKTRHSGKRARVIPKPGRR